ncbi:MAG: hypothetical protein GY852_10830 [bacterium]|nr:hypothetical protein [bacterium]
MKKQTPRSPHAPAATSHPNSSPRGFRGSRMLDSGKPSLPLLEKEVKKMFVIASVKSLRGEFRQFWIETLHYNRIPRNKHGWTLEEINEEGIIPRNQLLFAMAMRHEHPLISEMFSPESKAVPRGHLHRMVQENVLKGLKFLDLGCGHRPLFARISRQMGAQSYTIDRTSSLGFIKPQFGDGSAEISHHIQLDLAREDAIGVIMGRTGGNFDLITTASFTVDSRKAVFPDGTMSRFRPLLREGGLMIADPGSKILSLL